MKTRSTCHLEAARPTTHHLPQDHHLNTVYENGKTAQVATEMRNYRLSFLGISESRWTGSGQRRLITGELLLFSEHEQENAPHTQGVALKLSRTAQRALIGWEGHSLLIITATFRTNERRINMNMIQCYAPTNDSDDQDKEAFYSRLLTIIQYPPEQNVIIVMGDFNAKLAVIQGLRGDHTPNS